MRVSREGVMWLRQMGLHYTILHESVEHLVQQFERKLTVKLSVKHVEIIKLMPNSIGYSQAQKCQS